jgi:hypothetical protein
VGGRASMARVRVHPCQDDSLDHLRFVPVDKMDPRFAGEGPCGFAHQCQIALAPVDLPRHLKVGGNQHGKWLECDRCALRLGYWPKQDAPGHCARREHPGKVRRALNLVRDAGLWDRCSAADVKAALAAESRGRGGGGAARRANDCQGEATVPRASSWGPTRPVEPPLATTRQRAASCEPRNGKCIHLTLTASPGAVVTINC